MPIPAQDALFFQDAAATPIYPVTSEGFEAWLAERPAAQRAFLSVSGFKGQKGRIALLPDADGALAAVAFGLGDGDDALISAALAEGLPAGDYKMEPGAGIQDDLIALGWALGAYRFDRYTAKEGDGPKETPRLKVSEADAQRAYVQAEAMTLVRDLVNTPACDMGPSDLAAAVKAVAERFGAEYDEIVGDDLLTEGYPMVHAVGRAATDAPRLTWFTWGEADAPKLTLVGKGVCFDTGGLNLKPGQYMRNMKKDMGGAAHVLALSTLIMEAKLPVRLKVIIPAVENAIGGGAFRPGDVLPSRKGISVEIGNTDAEGRLILGDALALADEESPDLLLDMATLTGAARVALGPELPPFYTRSADVAAEVMRQAEAVADPMWHMPLWPGYEVNLKSDIADVCHISDSPKGGSITAALFLGRFVADAKDWVHVDVYAWNDRGRPGRPKGGDAQGLRALFAALQARYPR